ncbi:MAG TPA: type I 3-dehydroquinate dehydratase [Nitrososphaerales archaeon]|nr:type I 3-dehydroquinate dehydratase [Nitrososphaerales archaeon]
MAKKRVQSKVCASIGADSLDGMVRKTEYAFRLGSDLVEFRIDRLTSRVTPSEITAKLRRFASRSIVTVRSKRQGGGFNGGDIERLGLISELATMRPAYLDIELETAAINEGWTGSLPKKVERIVSWHDFKGTPDIKKLRKTCEDELAHGSIAKVVTTATKIEDNLNALRLCEENPGRVASFCMGELGVTSRLLSMFLGAPIAYAALPNDSMAPGQLPISAMIEFRGLVPKDEDR